MTSHHQSAELEIRRQSQELAVAWRKGRAAFVLDALEAQGPVRAALIATLIDEALTRWEPYDARSTNRFRHALLLRAEGVLTPYELAELEREYRRRFGSLPPLPPRVSGVPRAPEQNGARQPGGSKNENLALVHAGRIRSALAADQPIVREREPAGSPRFLRLQPARR